MENKTFIYALSAALVVLPACNKTSSTTATTTAPTKKAHYHCPMHPQYTSDKPGDCPICGMRLVQIESASETPSVSATPGQANVVMSDDRVQLIGVKTSKVEMRELVRDIRTSARVAYDPALYSAIVEHQEALKAAGSNTDDTTVRASRLRLRQMGLSNAQIKEISAPGYDASHLLLSQAGHRLWVYADLYEDEASLVKTGQTAVLTAPAFPGRTFLGTVRAVDTVVNSETRTLRARIDVPNPTGELKPDMYFQASIQARLGRHLAIPSTAVMDSGSRHLVFLQTQPGHYSPRDVVAGLSADPWMEVVSGLKEGDVVVTSANFLIDSESKIKGTIQP